MPDAYTQVIRALPPAKSFAIGIYGESVASYRYRTLAEKTTSDHRRRVFLEMADEEHGHHQALNKIVHDKYSGTDFVLTPEDKELVIVGPRMIEVTDAASVNAALDLIYESERLTGRFYQALHDTTPLPELKPFLKEMADECYDHAERLMELKDNE